MTTWWRQLGGCRFIVKAVLCWSRRCGNVASWQREPALLSAACTHTHAYTYHNHVLTYGGARQRRGSPARLLQCCLLRACNVSATTGRYMIIIIIIITIVITIPSLCGYIMVFTVLRALLPTSRSEVILLKARAFYPVRSCSAPRRYRVMLCPRVRLGRTNLI